MRNIDTKEILNKFFLVLAIILTAGLAFLTFLSFFGVGAIYLFHQRVEEFVTVRLGADYYFAQFLTKTVVSIFVLFGPGWAWRSIVKRQKFAGSGIVSGTHLLILISVYTVGADVCFDRNTGRPLCYFADTPAGRKWSKTPGFDPESGIPFRLYTREFKESEAKPHTIVPISRESTIDSRRLNPSREEEQPGSEKRSLVLPVAEPRLENSRGRSDSCCPTETRRAKATNNKIPREHTSQISSSERREDSIQESYVPVFHKEETAPSRVNVENENQRFPEQNTKRPVPAPNPTPKRKHPARQAADDALKVLKDEGMRRLKRKIKNF